ncbi:Adenine specific DNA methyltransferase [Microcystis aeruginosa PCC 9432]|uniref:site-specific DNA-methyltransferase (adenine-specific) n=1 Tax=Microcystis aeruginosa PCC 9432 TaxID=1160280 RepID=A0A822L4U9_MICAE|nr:type ISP restriction/modification enzyme [Microcystis aeruginosa]TRT93242.1 MAG: DNA methyltransferase [Microcystis aeruginosa Ma_OC_LR_19540900_S633]CCH91019.1 Adenine specific DNA methyltransferase [Microcystis aeruginosa PCC 9432]
MNPLVNYFRNLHEIHSSQAAVKETSYYGTLETLLNEIGKTLKPRVRCIINLRNQGAGLPDGGLFNVDQFQKNQELEPFTAIFPERGAIEIKGTKEDIKKIAASEQVQKYWQKYGQVLVTNYRDFLLIGRNSQGQPVELEAYSLAPSEAEFWLKTSNPSKFAAEHGDSLLEYLKRVLLQAAPITSPADVAWFLASYARDAKARLEHHSDLPALANIRQALENALGIKFEREQGNKFFRSTLVQTLFYGLFSAWVLWHKQNLNREDKEDKFDWKSAAHHLHVPMLAILFEQIAAPSKLKSLGLVEVLNWTGAALNRVRREEFFRQFDEGQAVQYFYEPFLQAFDPDLRKELGVWYTPPEIVRYMVARVDRVLREELNIEDGLANPDVYVLDPCCGTGAYLVEVLRYITDTLQENGAGALAMALVKKAAIERIFGFEILTAPFVVAHLQLGLFLQSLGVPLIEDSERVGIYLTNALTGWQPPDEESKQKIQQLQLSFPELNKEREAADEVKRGKPILVILGNPPYNAFAGTSPAEEAGLVEVYKQGLISDWGIKKFNLDELYVRFFRLAERCISENTGKGVVCYISNYSWVSEPSFVVLRQNLLKNFNKFWIENMHGNRKISEYAPDGRTSETIFSIPGFSAGIQQGVVISLWLKNSSQQGTKVLFRDDIDAAKAVERRSQLLESLNNQDFDSLYQVSNPEQSNRYSFRPSDVSSHYLAWPKLTDLCKIMPFNGPVERRGNSLIVYKTDRNQLELIELYLDPNKTDQEIEAIAPRWMKSSGEFKAEKSRKAKLRDNVSYKPDKIIPYPFKPFDIRLAYLDSEIQPLFSRPSPELLAQKEIILNSFFISRDTADKSPEGSPFYFSKLVCDYDCISGHARHFPILLKPESKQKTQKYSKQLFNTQEFIDTTLTANLSEKSRQYLNQLGINNLDENIENASLIWLHSLAIGYSPLYLGENADGIRQDFPRIPLPNSQELLIKSAQLGQAIASLLDTENPVIGVTKKPTPALQKIALISCTDGGNLNPDKGDLIINVGWGHGGKNGVTMPGKGKAIARQYTTAEMSVISPEMRKLLGTTTYDIYLNDRAYWQNIPARVWEYTIGGYQVIKKWLSYREEKLLGRGLTIAEVQEVSEMTRRITAIILLESDLDDNYQNIKTAVYSF